MKYQGALFAQQIAEEDGTDDENAQNNEKPISPIGRASPYSRWNFIVYLY